MGPGGHLGYNFPSKSVRRLRRTDPVMTRKKAIAIAVLAVILTAGAAAYGWWGARSAAPEYRFGKVERGAITAAISATGTVNPVTAVQVGSQVSGQIKEITVDFNSEVKKDQVIARIDPESFALRVKPGNGGPGSGTRHRAHPARQRRRIAD